MLAGADITLSPALKLSSSAANNKLTKTCYVVRNAQDDQPDCCGSRCSTALSSSGHLDAQCDSTFNGRDSMLSSILT